MKITITKSDGTTMEALVADDSAVELQTSAGYEVDISAVDKDGYRVVTSPDWENAEMIRDTRIKTKSELLAEQFVDAGLEPVVAERAAKIALEFVEATA